MLGYLKRLVTTGAAYQAADVVSRVFALVTLPLYLHHLTPRDYGIAETIVTSFPAAAYWRPLRRFAHG